MGNSSYTRNRKSRRSSRRRRTRRRRNSRRRRRQRGGGPGSKLQGATLADLKKQIEDHNAMSAEEGHGGKKDDGGGLPKGDGTPPNTANSDKPPHSWSGAKGVDKAALKKAMKQEVEDSASRAESASAAQAAVKEAEVAAEEAKVAQRAAEAAAKAAGGASKANELGAYEVGRTQGCAT